MDTLSQKKKKRMNVDFNNPFPPYPKEIFFDITSICNHRCFFCSNTKLKKNYFMDKHLAFRLFEELNENGVKDIALYATGEPFLHKDLAEMTDKAKKIGIQYVFISTNGSLATPERSRPVLDAGIDSIKFSINAGTKESYINIHGKDHFDRVISNIKWFSDYRSKSNLKYKIYVSMVETKETKGQHLFLEKNLSPYIDEFDIRGCSNQGGNMYENNEKENINKNNLLGSLKESQFCNKCPDIFNRLTVTPEGYASACCVDYQNYLILGDLNTMTIKEIWHSERTVNFRKRHISNNLKGLICYNCLNNLNENCYPLTSKYARK